MAETKIKKGEQEADRWDMPKGTWLRITFEGGVSARMTCPGCGTTGTLTQHSIDAQGNVKPSVDCTECEYHESGVVLEGWKG